MNEQNISRLATSVYALAALALILTFSVYGMRKEGVSAQASAEGYKGKITVEVSAVNGKITAAKLLSSEDSDFTLSAIEGIIAQAVKNGGTAGLDIVSGATYSSKAVIKALNEALETAGQTAAQSAQ